MSQAGSVLHMSRYSSEQKGLHNTLANHHSTHLG